MTNRLSLISAPSNLGLKPLIANHEPGANKAPEVLLRHGLASLPSISTRLTVRPPEYSFEFDESIGIRNAESIKAYSFDLAKVVSDNYSNDFFSLVLGGDCSILLGSMLGLLNIGRFGLVFIDGHDDFHTPSKSTTGGAAGMDLALVTGRGPDILTRLSGSGSIVQDEDVIVVANRASAFEADSETLAIASTNISTIPLNQFRRSRPEEIAEQILVKFSGERIDGFWIHLDVDVLSTGLMPAVDSPQEGGLTYEELGQLLSPLLKNKKAAGLEVTIYDPEKDAEEQAGRKLAEFLVSVLSD